MHCLPCQKFDHLSITLAHKETRVASVSPEGRVRCLARTPPQHVTEYNFWAAVITSRDRHKGKMTNSEDEHARMRVQWLGQDKSALAMSTRLSQI
jgi:hypothetical protein